MAGTIEEGRLEQSDDGSHYERLYREQVFDAFICPLTKELMRDPVTLESGQTFERQAIEQWFEECRENGRRLTCPVTLMELRSTELNPSIGLRKAIEEWNARNEAAELDNARRWLSSSSSENENIRALRFVQNQCVKNHLNKQVIRDYELIPMIIDLLRSSSRRVRCHTLETLRILVEGDTGNKVIVAEGDTVRTIVKSLSREQNEKEKAVSLLYELSKMDLLCERIGAVNGAIFLLVGIASSTSDDVASVVNAADRTLDNLAQCEFNVKQMADCGRLQPLLTLLLEGPPGTALSMAAVLGELVLNSDVKVFAARTAGSSLINLMKSTNVESREAALKALNQISSDEASARILVEEGILPPLVRDLFTVEPKNLPARLKEVSATILANIVNSGCEFGRIPVGSNQQTLVSEGIIHKLLHLINNTGPAIECKLLQVLVGLTSCSSYISSVVSAIESSGATNSLVQFIEVPQKELRLASIKLLQNLSPHMGSELASCLWSTSGQLGSLIKVITENGAISEEQAAAVGFLSDLPATDTALTKRMLDEGVFQMFISRITRIRHGEVGRFITPYLEGLVKVLSRVSFAVSEPDVRALCRDHNLGFIFVDLLQANGLDNVQMVSATALEKLSHESKNLSQTPGIPPPGLCASFFPCLSKPPVVTGLCPVHRGICSFNETFCLLEGQAVDKLVALLDHQNDRVVEASLGALCTLLEDGVNIDEGIQVLLDPSEGAKRILDLLLEAQSESLRRKTVWAVERLLRNADVASEVCCDQNINTALVNAYQHGDFRTRQVAERALKHVDRIPNFSGIFPNAG